LVDLNEMSRSCFAIVAVVAMLFGCRGHGQRGDILLITVDTLRADHMSLYGYERVTTPNIDDWFDAKRAAVYTRSYSAAAMTAPSVVSILSGQRPASHGVRLLYQLLDKDVRLLPGLLGDHYVSAAVVSNLALTREALGIGDRFDEYNDFVDERAAPHVFERKATGTTDAALEWLRTAPSDRPTFLWVHYIDPHGPYDPPQEYLRRFTHSTPQPIPRSRIPAYQRVDDIDDGREYIDRYDEEIFYTDVEVGRLLSGYERVRGVDHALVLFTADHGESMMDHEVYFSHGNNVYEEYVRVPLMLRGPGVQPGRYETVVSGIDIAPTILRVAGSPIPARMPAVDLRTAAGAKAERFVFTEGGFPTKRRAAIQGGRKWIAKTDRDGAIVGGKYFDLGADPGEDSAMPWDEAPAHGKALIVAAVEGDPDPGGYPEEYAKGERLENPKVAPRVGAADRERLRQLGYIE